MAREPAQLPQLGFEVKMPLPEVSPERAEFVRAKFEHAGLEFQFAEDGDGYFKTQACTAERRACMTRLRLSMLLLCPSSSHFVVQL